LLLQVDCLSTLITQIRFHYVIRAVLSNGCRRIYLLLIYIMFSLEKSLLRRDCKLTQNLHVHGWINEVFIISHFLSG